MSTTGPPPAAAAGYFVDQKKGEVNELKQLLKNINVERDNKKKRDTIKKVIAYMTLGIDVSRLFTEMIMAVETRDIVVKKMVYLYLSNYAHKEPDLAIMCINTLRRDCDNEDPMVRGLALRSLSNLRLETILEYVNQPLSKSLTDISSYVRKTGVLGILKLYYLSPSTVETYNYKEKLVQMLQDVDASVVTNVIFALNEMLISEGGIEPTQATIMGLLNRIGEFGEWGLNAVLDLVSRYTPASEDESFAVMNLLDPVFRTANSGTVLATFKCFLSLVSRMPEMQPQLYERAKPPFLTLITGGYSEVQFTMLKHLQIILPRMAARGVFDDEYRHFFVRYNEPPYVKTLKVNLLPLITNRSNCAEVSRELSEYVTDVDSELSKCAINAIATIAMRVPEHAAEMTQTLLQMVDLDVQYVRSEAMKCIGNVLRVYPGAKESVLPSLSRCFSRVGDDPEAKATLIWILGEYGESIVEAPYMLETAINNYSDSSSIIKLHLLSAAMKLFFKRPPEMQAMLGKLLSDAVDDSASQDVHDRALLFYRLLSTDVSVAQAVFSGHSAALTGAAGGDEAFVFAEQREAEKLNRVFAEFNTLAVIYGNSSSTFIEEEKQLKFDPILLPDFNPANPPIPSLAAAPSPTLVPPPAPIQSPHSCPNPFSHWQPHLLHLPIPSQHPSLPHPPHSTCWISSMTALPLLNLPLPLPRV